MKKLGKFSKFIITVLVILTMQITFTANKVSAKEPSKTGIDDIMEAGNDWIGGATKIKNTSPEYFAKQFVGIGQVLVGIGIVTLLIVGFVMAIKWITASPDKQAVLKQQLIGLVAATIVIFGAIGIWNLVRSIGENVETKMETSESNSNTTYSCYASVPEKV